MTMLPVYWKTVPINAAVMRDLKEMEKTATVSVQ